MPEKTSAGEHRSGKGRPFRDGIGPRLWLLAGCWDVKIGDFGKALAPETAAANWPSTMTDWLNPRIGTSKDSDIREKFDDVCQLVLKQALSDRMQSQADLKTALEGTQAEFFDFMAASARGLDRDSSRGSPSKLTRERVSRTQIMTTEFELVGLNQENLSHYLEEAFPHLMGLDKARGPKPQLRKTQGKVQALLFMYRLGFNLPESHQTLRFRYDGVKLAGDTLGLVLRRIPARLIFDPASPYRLKYEEYYQDQLSATPDDPFEADAYAYVFENFATIISKDAGGAVDRRLSLVHIDWKRFKNDRKLEYLPGVAAMDSDCYPQADDVAPTAYRVLFKGAPEGLEPKGKGRKVEKSDFENDDERKWHILKTYSQTIKLSDANKDGIIDLGDGADWGIESDLGGRQPWHWVDYFKRLNVIRCPADLTVARYVAFGGVNAGAVWTPISE